MKLSTLVVLGVAVVHLSFSAGCARMSDKPTYVVLQNPVTMEFVHCEVGQWSTKSAFAKNEQCVEDYKRQGFVVWAKR
ncbi:hypothetical protein [Desulforhopalus sp. IMCC35007]|uniref:hypothetical protein n=1 Tax=Desulforhopalus sp. IMCC35007 TaxID=2569543 RepID=UPI0010AE5554|nr:hypothetical protein [Desulforhopalus sp. IMCC35007]TKB06053.1 hypothetical protein FCL48_22385 [Desulforhopalus sp. IMCC35007]